MIVFKENEIWCEISGTSWNERIIVREIDKSCGILDYLTCRKFLFYIINNFMLLFEYKEMDFLTNTFISSRIKVVNSILIMSEFREFVWDWRGNSYKNVFENTFWSMYFNLTQEVSFILRISYSHLNVFYWKCSYSANIIVIFKLYWKRGLHCIHHSVFHLNEE